MSVGKDSAQPVRVQMLNPGTTIVIQVEGSKEEIVKSWTISFTMIVTTSGGMSRVHWVPLLETEKNIVVDCRTS